MKQNLYSFIIKTIVILFLVGNTFNTWSQSSIKINNRNVNIQALNQDLQNLSLKANTAHPYQCLMIFNTSPNPKSLQAKGIILQEYVDQNTFMVNIISSIQISNLDKSIIGWAPILAEDKIGKYLLSLNSNNTDILISLAKGSDTSFIKDLLSNTKATYKAEQLWASQNKWILNCATSALNVIAANPHVLNISPYFQDVSLNDQAIMYTNAAYARNKEGFGLLGDGIVVGVGDDTYPIHIDLDKRANNFNPNLNTNHGIHTSGTVAGAGIVNESYTGYAPKADLVTNFFSRIVAYAADYDDNFNMKITNNSYAAIVGNCNYAGTYDGTSQFMDELAISNPYLLNIFAAGNDGYMQCGAYPTRYGTVVGSYQAAKNTLVVGLTGKNEDHINENGSKGPVKDGRLKPEITSPGHQIVSTSFNNDYVMSSGTSMASPTVAGAAALLQERFKQLNANQYPKNDLLKAILMNSATDLGRPGPDYDFGFGRMNVGKALDIINNGTYFAGNLNHLAQQLHTITVPANMAQLKVMLYWNDVSASPANAKALVNDIDLTVITPNSAIHFPLILNPEPAHVMDTAVQGVDHLNNVEQVVINNPNPGNYTLNVSGFNIPSGNQNYVLVYSFIPNEIDIVYPTAGTKMEANIPTLIEWEAPGNTGNFTVDYSLDNGTTWTNLTSVLPNKRYSLWSPVGIATDQARVRVSRPGATSTSEKFSIIARPTIQLASDQCPGSIHLQWNNIAGATMYYLYRKIGAEMTIVDSTLNNYYIYTGLNVDSIYWVSVAAGINQAKSIRANAISHQPNTGSCTGTAFNGDLAILNITAPHNGRQFTNSALSNNETLSLVIDNRDNDACNDFEIKYSINGGTWQTSTHNIAIPGLSQTTVNINGLNLSNIGHYKIDAVVRNLSQTDPITANDSFSINLKHLSNAALNLNTSFEETFESTPVILSQNALFGLENAERFDFDRSKPRGRLRTFVQNQINITGNRSISLDNSLNEKNDIDQSSRNSLTGTFNLSNYNINTDEIRFEFDYILHGVPTFDTSNAVQIRGSENDNWIKLYPYDTNYIGVVQKYGPYSLRDFLDNNNQAFSTSSQIAIVQRDISLIGGINYGRGLTIDNFKLFVAQNDLALIRALNIKKFNCNLNNAVPLTVEVANTMQDAKTNIPIFYQVDNQAIVAETIPLINGKDSILYTFNTAMNLSAPGEHNVKVWLAFPGDNYAYNDTISNITIHNQPYVNTYPYLENFETNNGYFFSEGFNNSWEYGSPNGINIEKAASGNYAWKTGIQSSHNANEKSYLYSPCFNLSQLDNPMLSFSLFREIESPNNTDHFDSAYVEYSTDGGLSWSVLGAYDEGYNWYNYENNTWMGTDENYWQVSSIALPKVNNLSLRWYFGSDAGAEFGGIAIDDIHIFDYQKPIFDQDSLSSAITSPVSSLTTFEQSNHIAGIIDPLINNLGTVQFQAYRHQNHVSPDSQQLYLPTNFAIKATTQTTSDIQLSLYVKDSLMKVVRTSTACSSCTSQPRTVYQMGVTTYKDNNEAVINHKLEDDSNGVFQYINADNVRWVPYFDGYYAVFNTNQIGEYWFNDGGITRNNPLPLNTLTFTAQKSGARASLLKWNNTIDNKVAVYLIQSNEGNGFTAIGNVMSIQDTQFEYTFIDTPKLLTQAYVDYRLKYTNLNGSVFYSPSRRLMWDNLPSNFEVFPNPTHDGTIYFRWYNNKEEQFNWAVFAINGQKIAAGTVEQNQFSGTREISLKNSVHIGDMYILKIFFKNKTEEYKIIYQPR